MTYRVIVMFERSLADDKGVIGSEQVTDEDLIRQFCKELQMAYDDCAMAGSFKVIGIDREGTISTWSI